MHLTFLDRTGSSCLLYSISSSSSQRLPNGEWNGFFLLFWLSAKKETMQKMESSLWLLLYWAAFSILRKLTFCHQLPFPPTTQNKKQEGVDDSVCIRQLWCGSILHSSLPFSNCNEYIFLLRIFEICIQNSNFIRWYFNWSKFKS